MKTFPSIARALTFDTDDLPWFIIAMAHLGFAALFFIMMGLMMPHAQARTAEALDSNESCISDDLYAHYLKDDPALGQSVDEAMAETAYGNGRFWKLEKAGQAPRYVFGTFHISDPRVTTLPEPVQAAYDRSDAIILETTDVLDPQKVAAFLAENPQFTQLEAGQSLSDFLEGDEEALLKNHFADRGIPLISIQKMRPWLYMSLVAMPACELARVQSGAKVLDMKLGLDARAKGRDVLGLETVGEQAAAINSQALDLQIDALVQTAKLGKKVDGLFESMTQLYLEGKIGAIMPMVEIVTQKMLPDEEVVDQSGFEEEVIVKRNHKMVERAMVIFDEREDDTIFVAVGSLHLPGEDGVLQLFEQAGYQVSRVD